jgi:3-hydroxyacyl-CoA dehydrogenase
MAGIKASVIGAGFMGAGIAEIFAANGHRVRLMGVRDQTAFDDGNPGESQDRHLLK